MKSIVMQRRSLLSLIIALCMFISIISICGVSVKVSATQLSYLDSNKYYYIKNVNSGQYLTVASDNVNVVQSNYQGNSRQRWKLIYTQTGDYAGYYRLKSSYDTTKFLTVNAANNYDCTNIKIDTLSNSSKHYFSLNGSDYSFSFGAATRIVMYTCASNQSKVVRVQNDSFEPAANVYQYSYNSSTSAQWLFEPTGGYDPGYGANYAKVQYNHRIPTYPNLDNYTSLQDNTNFVSQCLAAGGYHYNSDWYSKKKNNIRLSPTDEDQLSESWYHTPQSKWINSDCFYDYWSNQNQQIPNLSYSIGCITGNLQSGDPFTISTGDAAQFLKQERSWGYVAFFSMYVADESENEITADNLGDILVTFHKYSEVQNNQTINLQDNQGIELWLVCYAPPINNNVNYRVLFYDFYADPESVN